MEFRFTDFTASAGQLLTYTLPIILWKKRIQMKHLTLQSAQSKILRTLWRPLPEVFGHAITITVSAVIGNATCNTFPVARVCIYPPALQDSQMQRDKETEQREMQRQIHDEFTYVIMVV